MERSSWGGYVGLTTLIISVATIGLLLSGTYLGQLMIRRTTPMP